MAESPTEEKRLDYAREQDAARAAREADQERQRAVGVARVMRSRLRRMRMHVNNMVSRQEWWPDSYQMESAPPREEMQLVAGYLSRAEWHAVETGEWSMDIILVRRRSRERLMEDDDVAPPFLERDIAFMGEAGTLIDKALLALAELAEADIEEEARVTERIAARRAERQALRDEGVVQADVATEADAEVQDEVEVATEAAAADAGED
jgi:hypothetical protein